MNETRQPTLIITGMHRSGTSLVSSLLQSAGLDIGKNLVAGNEGNIKGHFENKDFVDFHEKVLYSLGINQIGWTLERDLTPPPAYQDEAKNLIESDLSPHKPWGWKDPRTCLFLSFWYSLIPDSKFLFVYRSPWEVLDSLFRRGDDIFHRHPEFALQIWMSYNQAILDFYQQYPERCLLVNINQVTVNPDFLIEAIATKLKINLSDVDKSLYESHLLKQLSHNSQRPYQIKLFFPSAFALYEELNAVSGYEDKILASLTQEFCQGFLLQDWVDVKRMERLLAHEKKDSTEHLQRLYYEIGDLRYQIGVKEQDLQQSQQESEKMRSQFEDFEQEFQEIQSYLQQELAETRQHLTKYEEDFQGVKAHLTHTQQELEEIRRHLTETQQELEETRRHLTETQQQLTQTKSRLDECEEELPLLRGYFEKSQRELKETQDYLQETQAELNKMRSHSQALEERIKAMESSKFWQLRRQWFAFKRALRMTTEA